MANLKLIIFDLDDTLVPTNLLHEQRHSKAALELIEYKEFREAIPYQGIIDCLTRLSKNFKLGLVTSSPRWYALQVLKFHLPDIDFNPIITFNEVTELKPDPEPLMLALHEATAKNTEAIYIGNAGEDYIACNAAQITFIGAAWSCSRTYPDNGCDEASNPMELLEILVKYGI